MLAIASAQGAYAFNGIAPTAFAHQHRLKSIWQLKIELTANSGRSYKIPGRSKLSRFEFSPVRHSSSALFQRKMNDSDVIGDPERDRASSRILCFSTLHRLLLVARKYSYCNFSLDKFGLLVLSEFLTSI